MEGTAASEAPAPRRNTNQDAGECLSLGSLGQAHHKGFFFILPRRAGAVQRGGNHQGEDHFQQGKSCKDWEEAALKRCIRTATFPRKKCKTSDANLNCRLLKSGFKFLLGYELTQGPILKSVLSCYCQLQCCNCAVKALPQMLGPFLCHRASPPQGSCCTGAHGK